LDHELTARLARAYKPATYYMDIFVSPLATVVAKNIAFVAGSVLAVLILLTSEFGTSLGLQFPERLVEKTVIL
jgi:hypothetical protein